MVYPISSGVFHPFFSAHLQKMVERDNKKFEEWCMEMAEMRRQSVDKGKAKHEEVQELFNMLPTKEGLSIY